MRKKILPIMLAFAFLFSALVIVADDSDADASEKLVINGVTMSDDGYVDPSGRWSYDWWSNTLSLDNAVLTELYDDENEKISSIIYNSINDDENSLTIFLTGDNYIQEWSSPRQGNKGCGIFCEHLLRILGPGSLTINTSSYEHGLLVKDGLFIHGGAQVEVRSSGASFRVEGNDTYFTVQNSTVVSEKQIEVLSGVDGRGMRIDGGSVTFSTYMGFLDLGNSEEFDNGRLQFIDGGILKRIEGTSGEQSYPLVRCWNNGGPSRIDDSVSMYNADCDHTIHDNYEYVTVPNPEEPSYMGYFTSKVTFDANGGTCSTTSEFTQKTGKLESLPSPDAPEGFEFRGWFTEPRFGSGEQITTDTVFPEDTTVYAQWKLPALVEVTFNANGGSCDTPSMQTGWDGKLPSALPDATRDGYRFGGWYTTPDGGDRVTGSTVFTSDTTVYALWVNTHVIIFDGNGGDADVPFEITDLEGRLRMVPEATRDGHIFAGWYTAKEGGEKITKDTVFHGNDTVHAHWVKIYTVTFDGNGGRVAIKTAQTNIEGKLDSLSKAIRIGYHFLGWYTDADGGDEITTDTVFTSDTKVYAHWVRIYAVIFDANGGSCDTIITHTDDDSRVHSLPVATRDGYTFRGWYTDPEGGMKVTDVKIISSNMKVYAHWKENPGDFIKENTLGLEIAGVTLAAALAIVAVSFLIVRRK